MEFLSRMEEQKKQKIQAKKGKIIVQKKKAVDLLAEMRAVAADLKNKNTELQKENNKLRVLAKELIPEGKKRITLALKQQAKNIIEEEQRRIHTNKILNDAIQKGIEEEDRRRLLRREKVVFKIFNSAHKERLVDFRASNSKEYTGDYTIYFPKVQSAIKVLPKQLNMSSFKFHVGCQINFFKPTEPNNEGALVWINSKTKIVINKGSSAEVSETIKSAFDDIEKSIDKYQKRGSGFVYQYTDKIEVFFSRYKPLKGSSYIDLPKFIKDKKACINIKNKDNKCFEYVLSAGLMENLPPTHTDRVNNYNLENIQIPNGIEYPIKITDINKYEKLNNVAINVFYLQELTVCPLYRSKDNNTGLKEIDMLLISDNETSHYTLIKDLSKLTSSQKNNHKSKIYTCRSCLNHFNTQETLDKHIIICNNFNKNSSALSVMPEEGKTIKFKNFTHSVPEPFTIVADFESFIDPETKQHDANSYSYVVICHLDPSLSKPIVIKHGTTGDFMNDIKIETDNILSIYQANRDSPIKLTPNEMREYKDKWTCDYCDRQLYDYNTIKNISTEERELNGIRKSDFKVRDHCHLTGKFRATSCSKCNLQARSPRNIPIIFHNLKGYDSHLIIKELNKDSGKITCIPNTEESYLSFTVGSAKFVDSFQFLSASLDSLVESLYEGGKGEHKFIQTKTAFGSDTVGLKMLMRKIPYPYEYMSEAKMDQVVSLNPEDFHDTLNEKDISVEDYTHYLKIVNHFKFSSLKDYHNLYLKLDVCLLADVVENFRTICLEKYKLDPMYYITSPGLAWDAMLKMTDVELELLSDVDKYMFFEKSKRGGLSVITGRHGIANNKYMKTFNPEEETKYLMYLDMNNLYGGAMCQSLPVSNFKWENDLDINSILQTPDDSDVGYTLEVDLEYPQELHDLHNDYPLCPENITIKNSDMSKYCKALKNKLAVNEKITEDQTPKLIANLKDKKNYTLNYRYLKLAVRLGLKITKVHQIMSYSQSAWLKTYIDFNTKERTASKSDFEKDFFKLMNNSVFGKTMENVRNRINFDLLNDGDAIEKRVNKPNFVKRVKFNEDLYGVHMLKNKVILDKPIYVGVTILDLSKVDMSEFHFDYMKNKYGNKARLLFTDTDSLCYEIKTDDIYKDMKEQSYRFDLSNYESEHFLHDTTNKKQLFKMKDELGGKVMTEFVGLRAKMYSHIHEDGDAIKAKQAGKGIKRSTLKKIKHEQYRDTLIKEQQTNVSFKSIQSRDHILSTKTINKIGLSPFDNKRYILADGNHTRAYGHYLNEY